MGRYPPIPWPILAYFNSPGLLLSIFCPSLLFHFFPHSFFIFLCSLLLFYFFSCSRIFFTGVAISTRILTQGGATAQGTISFTHKIFLVAKFLFFNVDTPNFAKNITVHYLTLSVFGFCNFPSSENVPIEAHYNISHKAVILYLRHNSLKVEFLHNSQNSSCQ